MTTPISEVFRVTVDDMADPVLAADQLNMILSHIADRLDQMQGLRGDAVVRGQFIVQDSDGNEVGGFKNT